MSQLSPTLSGYLARRFLGASCIAFGILAAVILLFDTMELLRRTSGHSEATFDVVLGMAVLNLPKLAERAIPFAALFGALWSFALLSRARELVIARTSGVSVWQFLLPPMGVAFCLGLFAVGIFNPLAAAMSARFEVLENQYLNRAGGNLAVSATGIWLRQVEAAGQSVVHGRRVTQQQPELELKGVMILLYGADGELQTRLDADRGWLRDGHWLLKNALVTRPQSPSSPHQTYVQETKLTTAGIENSLAPPTVHSFWSLPRFIRLLQAAGISARGHQIHWQFLLATPFFIAAMVLIAATFALGAGGRLGTWRIISGGVLAGFVLFSLTDLSLALGLSGSIPPVLAAWSPTGIGMLLGLAMLFRLEDG